MHGNTIPSGLVSLDYDRFFYAYPATESTPSLGTPLVGRENVNVSINGSQQPIEFTIDSGADINIMRTDSANLIKFNMSTPSRHETITTVGGTSTQIPIFNVQFGIEGNSPIAVEMGVHPQSPFNLITIEAIAQVFNAVVNPNGGFDLTPKGQAPVSPKPSQTQPQVQPQPTPISTAPPIIPGNIPTIPTPTAPILQPLAKTGNIILDAVRELYRAICGLGFKIPLLCDSPLQFAIIFTIIVVVLIILVMRGG